MKRNKSTTKKKKFIILILIVINVLLLASIIGVNAYVDSFLNKIDRENEVNQNEIKVEEFHKRDVNNILLIGQDDGRSDAMKIISMDNDNKKLSLYNVQRDNYVWFPNEQKYDNLNHAYWYGGIKESLEVFNYNFDLDMNQYVIFTFDSVKAIVNYLGGVDIYLSYAEASYLGLYNGEGMYNLNGNQALEFARIRSIDSDYQRMERQTRLIDAIIQKVKNSSITDILGMISDLMPYVQTNITNDQIKKYVAQLLSYDLANIEQYQFPVNGYDSIYKKIVKDGLLHYILKDFEGEVKLMHYNIYGDEKYVPSDNVKKVAQETMEIANSYY